MKSFLVVAVSTIIALVILEEKMAAGTDVDATYLSVFKARNACHKGYPGVPAKIVNDAREKCKELKITNIDCYKACLYVKAGGFDAAGKYQETQMNVIIDSMFTDGATNEIAKKWHKDTKDCADANKGELEKHYPKDFTKGNCQHLDKFEQCLAASRNCK